jgi:8-oxo-dGTP pyrophosphatase MutT (NUDIX family)
LQPSNWKAGDCFDMSVSYNRTIETLQRRLAAPLPGAAAQMKMAPVRPEAVERLSVEDRNCREAAVLALLTPASGEAHLVMTVRRAHLTQHAGQVSFPGGRRDLDEELRETALRETHEEIGLDPADIVLLGNLTPLYVPPSGFCVYPFVGMTRHEPDLVPHDYEVERIVHVPLQAFRQPDSIHMEEWTIRGERVLVPYFEVHGLIVWGATAMMVAELIALFE